MDKQKMIAKIVYQWASDVSSDIAITKIDLKEENSIIVITDLCHFLIEKNQIEIFPQYEIYSNENVQRLMDLMESTLELQNDIFNI